MISPGELSLLFQSMLEDEEDASARARGQEPECHHRFYDGRPATRMLGFDRNDNAHAVCNICGEVLEQ